MKIIVLGGTGIIGRWVVQDLLDFSDAEIVVAAQKAQPHRSSRVTAVSVDVTDVVKTARILKNADVVVNCVNYYFNLQVMRACLYAGVHYVDLGGLFHMTNKQLRLHAQFKRKKLLAVLGCGSTPGITNVMAAYGLRYFDRVTGINVSFGGHDFVHHSQPFVLPYTLHTLFDEFSMKPAVLKNGKIKMVLPLSGKTALVFPSPVGRQTGFYTLHSELATFPSSFHLKECSFRATFDDEFTEQIKFLIDTGFASTVPLHLNGTKVVPRQFTAKIMEQWLPKKVNDVEMLRVEMVGKTKGKKMTKVLYCVARSHGNVSAGVYDTAVPASIVTQMIAHCKIKERGVLPPEKCIEPELFFEELGRRKILVSIS